MKTELNPQDFISSSAYYAALNFEQERDQLLSDREELLNALEEAVNDIEENALEAKDFPWFDKCKALISKLRKQ